jgi:murein DD-endopeptidase MepM/ murein hydrolase activator NlpD
MISSVHKLLSNSGILTVLNRASSRLRVRDRYVLTRHNTIRLRYMVAPAFAVMFTTVGIASSLAPRLMYQHVAASPLQVASVGSYDDNDRDFVPAPYQDQQEAEADDESTAADEAEEKSVAPAPAQQVAQAAPQPKDTTVRIDRGDTLEEVLEDAGVSTADAYNAIQALRRYYDPRSITPGQKLSLHFDPAGAHSYNFSKLMVPVNLLSTVTLAKNADGSFGAALDKREAVRKVYARKADIDVSLFGSALESHIPAAVIAKAIRIYSWNVDFQRDIQPGDKLEVMYEQYETPDGTPIRSGEVLFANLTVNGNDNPIFRYETQGGDVDYFNPEGVSVRKALLSTPVDGARISSGFGMRFHPVLGYTKMHKGMDFAAPIGTPIYAAGNGMIERMGPFSTYGNYVRLRHNSTLKTAYAHMLRFAAGLHAGMKVHQGQVIGYIGVTGRSTGPHLHYEVLINDEQVNPRSVKVAQGEALKGPQLATFKSYVHTLYQRYEAMAASKFAALVPAAGQNALR